jgi:hypothetical protein
LDSTIPDRLPFFVDLAARMRIRHVFHSDHDYERFFLPEIMGGGAAFFDFDGDGRQDLYLVNGCALPQNKSDKRFLGSLCRNQRDGTFENVAAPAGLDLVFYGQGVAVGDYDNDGFDDLYLTALGECHLYRNNGDGTFTDRAAIAGVRHRGWATSCAFGDLDGDGNLDLYVANYVDTTLATNPPCSYDLNGRKVRGYCGPANYTAEPDAVYRNRGDGTFEEVTNAAGFEAPLGPGLAVAIADLNDDGRPDVYVANDKRPNYLFVNQTPPGGALRVKESAQNASCAVLGYGAAGASMGIAVGDYNGDGRLDLLVTEFLNEGAALFRNHGGAFSDASRATRLSAATRPFLGFGCGFFDYDNDGWLDVFLGNGHVLGPYMEPTEMHSQILRNVGGTHFVEMSQWAGPYFFRRFLTRGVAFGDWDDDGGMDVVAVHLDRPASLLHNETPHRGGFLGLDLVGTISNRSAINARATVQLAGGRRLVREVVGGGSYLSSSDRRLVFGLGTETKADSLEIRWPSGAVERFSNVPAGKYLRFVEGRPFRPSNP